MKNLYHDRCVSRVLIRFYIRTSCISGVWRAENIFSLSYSWNQELFAMWTNISHYNYKMLLEPIIVCCVFWKNTVYIILKKNIFEKNETNENISKSAEQNVWLVYMLRYILLLFPPGECICVPLQNMSCVVKAWWRRCMEVWFMMFYPALQDSAHLAFSRDGTFSWTENYFTRNITNIPHKLNMCFTEEKKKQNDSGSPLMTLCPQLIHPVNWVCLLSSVSWQKYLFLLPPHSPSDVKRSNPLKHRWAWWG